MRLSVRSVLEGGRLYAFPMVWAAVLAITAIVFFVMTKDDPGLAARRAAQA